MNVFLCHYGGQLKTTVEQKAGKKIDCKRSLESEKEVRISKWKVFVQYLPLHKNKLRFNEDKPCKLISS